MSEDTTADTNVHVGTPNDAVPQLQGTPPPKGKMQNLVATAAMTSMASIATAYGDISSDSEEEEEEVNMDHRSANSSYINSSQGGLTVDVKPPHESKTDNVVLGEEGQLVSSQVKAGDDCDPQTPNLLETVQSAEVAGNVGETTPESSVIPSIQEAFGGGTAHRSTNTGYGSDGESSDSSSSTTDSSGLEEFRQHLEPEDDGFKGPMKTRGELTLKDLPPIQELTINVTEEDKMTFLGTISSIVEELVVVKSEGTTPALDQDSILFLDNRVPLGQVFEIFGPVVQPYYSVRFNTSDEIKARGITIGCKVYFAPDRQDLFYPVNVVELRKLKGSDASWESNNEPPPKFLDFSDDEEERKAKKKGKGQGREGQQGHVAGRKRNRQERGEFASSSESDGSSEDEMQTFSGPHWPPRHPSSQQASAQPRFGHPRQPGPRHRGPRPGAPRQQSFQPRSSPGPRFSPQPMMRPPHFYNSFPNPHQDGSYMDPNQQRGYMNPAMPHGGQFGYQGQNVYDGQSAFASPFGWNSPGNQGHQQGFMPPHYGGYQPY